MNSYQNGVNVKCLEQSSCTGKKAYMSLREADQKAALSSFYSGEELRGYQCRFCHLFHMGHKKSKKCREAEGALGR